MDKDLYHPYINKDGKLVSGTAALLHHIFTVKNGLLDYHDEVSADVNAELAKQAKRDRFKVVS